MMKINKNILKQLLEKPAKEKKVDTATKSTAAATPTKPKTKETAKSKKNKEKKETAAKCFNHNADLVSGDSIAHSLIFISEYNHLFADFEYKLSPTQKKSLKNLQCDDNFRAAVAQFQRMSLFSGSGAGQGPRQNELGVVDDITLGFLSYAVKQILSYANNLSREQLSNLNLKIPPEVETFMDLVGAFEEPTRTGDYSKLFRLAGPQGPVSGPTPRDLTLQKFVGEVPKIEGKKYRIAGIGDSIMAGGYSYYNQLVTSFSDATLVGKIARGSANVYEIHTMAKALVDKNLASRKNKIQNLQKKNINWRNPKKGGKPKSIGYYQISIGSLKARKPKKGAKLKEFSDEEYEFKEENYPTHIIVTAGTNSMHSSASKVSTALGNIYSTIRKALPGVKIIGMTIGHSGRWHTDEAKKRKVTPILRRAAAGLVRKSAKKGKILSLERALQLILKSDRESYGRHDRINEVNQWINSNADIVVDTNAIANKELMTFCSGRAACKRLGAPRYWSSDRIHPNRSGHLVLAKHIAAAIRTDGKGTGLVGIPEYTPPVSGDMSQPSNARMAAPIKAIKVPKKKISVAAAKKAPIITGSRVHTARNPISDTQYRRAARMQQSLLGSVSSGAIWVGKKPKNGFYGDPKPPGITGPWIDMRPTRPGGGLTQAEISVDPRIIAATSAASAGAAAAAAAAKTPGITVSQPQGPVQAVKPIVAAAMPGKYSKFITPASLKEDCFSQAKHTASIDDVHGYLVKLGHLNFRWRSQTDPSKCTPQLQMAIAEFQYRHKLLSKKLGGIPDGIAGKRTISKMEDLLNIPDADRKIPRRKKGKRIRAKKGGPIQFPPTFDLNKYAGAENQALLKELDNKAQKLIQDYDSLGRQGQDARARRLLKPTNNDFMLSEKVGMPLPAFLAIRQIETGGAKAVVRFEDHVFRREAFKKGGRDPWDPRQKSRSLKKKAELFRKKFTEAEKATGALRNQIRSKILERDKKSIEGRYKGCHAGTCTPQEEDKLKKMIAPRIRGEIQNEVKKAFIREYIERARAKGKLQGITDKEVFVQLGIIGDGRNGKKAYKIARALDPIAAIRSASYGKYQTMGFHLFKPDGTHKHPSKFSGTIKDIEDTYVDGKTKDRDDELSQTMGLAEMTASPKMAAAVREGKFFHAAAWYNGDAPLNNIYFQHLKFSKSKGEQPTLPNTPMVPGTTLQEWDRLGKILARNLGIKKKSKAGVSRRKLLRECEKVVPGSSDRSKPEYGFFRWCNVLCNYSYGRKYGGPKNYGQLFSKSYRNHHTYIMKEIERQRAIVQGTGGGSTPA